MEPFILCHVINKGIAEENISDRNSHTITRGANYAEVEYLEKSSQRGKRVNYKKTKQNESVYIYITEVAVTNIDVDADLNMNISEYVYVSEAVL